MDATMAMGRRRCAWRQRLREELMGSTLEEWTPTQAIMTKGKLEKPCVMGMAKPRGGGPLRNHFPAPQGQEK